LHLGGHHSSVLRVIVWREADTHPELQRAVQELYHSLCHLTGQVLAHAAPDGVDARRRAAAAAAYASAMLFAANLARVGGPSVDLPAVAQLLADGLVARPGR
jgi:hypothetical protein